MTLAITINELVATFESTGGPSARINKAAAMKPLLIHIPDNLAAQDKLGTYKPWFNGMKHFYTVKSLPPRIKADLPNNVRDD